MNDLGVVAIGRNEGDRLRRCLESLVGLGATIVYVDSGSTDGSVELARSLGVEVVALDLSTPFTAARGRNAGFERLSSLAPDTLYVMFLDGDCQVADGFLDKARAELDARPEVAVTCGRRREKFPEHSIYNRLVDAEWEQPAGEIDACGGDSVMRADAFRAVGGFDPTVPAGEEPELCRRLRNAGWKVRRIDADMTWHDSAMLRFRQWWRRQFRSGYGAQDVVSRFGAGADLFGHQLRSAWTWAAGWPLAVIVAGALGLALGGAVAGGVAAAAVACVLPLQMARVARKGLRRGMDLGTAAAYGALTMIGKWAQLSGQVSFLKDRAAGRRARLIEYKAAGAGGGTVTRAPMRDPDWQADLARYPRRPWLKEQSVWAIAVYRFGRRVDRRRPGLRRKLLERWYWLVFRFTETLTGISIPKSVEVGPGLRIYHFGNIIVHADARIGANCTLRQGITIGNRHADGPTPILEDDVELGAYAQVLGGVRIGRGAKVGAMSVVLCDVPPGATAVGAPARVLERVASGSGGEGGAS